MCRAHMNEPLQDPAMPLARINIKKNLLTNALTLMLTCCSSATRIALIQLLLQKTFA